MVRFELTTFWSDAQCLNIPIHVYMSVMPRGVTDSENGSKPDDRRFAPRAPPLPVNIHRLTAQNVNRQMSQSKAKKLG